MRQLLQDFRNGSLSVKEVPVPLLRERGALVLTRCSVVSTGTERAVIEFASQGLLGKARSRPDLLKQVIRKIKSDGLTAAWRTSMSRLDTPLALGYSSSGEILEVGGAAPGFRVGDRVACGGGGYASHAEVVYVPRNLMAKIPDGVSDEDAAFATIGAIALQGVRVADLRLGERVVVIGLGLLGLLAVQLVKAAGCLVLGVDLNLERVRLAEKLGADSSCLFDPHGLVEVVNRFTLGRGADAVIITAATRSNEPVESSGEISRLRGRVVVVGDVRIDVPRRTYYEKELELRISRSYGPGRYDPDYEERGIDYPYAYVPFTEQRNMETFLQLVSERKVTPSRLITHRFPIEEAEEAYALIKGEVKEPYLGVLFTYPDQPDLRRRIPVVSPITVRGAAEAEVGVAVIGAGNYTRLMLLPRLKAMKDIRLLCVSTSGGLSAWMAAKRFGFEFATTDISEILNDNRVNLVVVATRHDSHASLAEMVLRAGKHVFVEKPLATSEEDLRAVVAAAEEIKLHLMVGFNRRFAPLIQKAKEKFGDHTQPLAMFYRVNAGAIPSSHWTQNPEEGGGRIVGEVCHFVDLLQYLCGSAPVSVFATSARGATGSIPPEDIVTITICFANGSIGTIHYFANGDKAVPKEYLEVYSGGRTFILDDFRRARYAEGGKVSHWKSRGQDKGHKGELQALIQMILTGGPTPISLSEAVLTTLTTFRILDSLRCGKEVPVEWSLDRDGANESSSPNHGS